MVHERGVSLALLRHSVPCVYGLCALVTFWWKVSWYARLHNKGERRCLLSKHSVMRCVSQQPGEMLCLVHTQIIAVVLLN